ncbi:hypothetical protein CL622_07710 [archaeon]|nr:hypothetical protein [archaeon]|tara:strand:- start:1434 stop:2081 length:648 start_codon:yes stop_codon:yes gene_type:complete
MLDFHEGKGKRIVKDSVLYEDSSPIYLEAEISLLVLEANKHPLLYTEAACKGHFGIFLKYREIFVVSDGELFLESTGKPMEEAFPDLDIQNGKFFYARGDIRLVISDCYEGNRLDGRLSEWVKQRSDRVHIEPNTECSDSGRGIAVILSPNISQWVRDEAPNYPLIKIRRYTFEELLKLNQDRRKTISELYGFFKQEVNVNQSFSSLLAPKNYYA